MTWFMVFFSFLNADTSYFYCLLIFPFIVSGFGDTLIKVFPDSKIEKKSSMISSDIFMVWLVLWSPGIYLA